MAVKTTIETDQLKLEIDNGDLKKIEQVMEKWKFKDHQSFIRFAVSALLLTEDKTLSLKMNGVQQPVVPAKEYLKD